jgi:hypothetical protein
MKCRHRATWPPWGPTAWCRCTPVHPCRARRGCGRARRARQGRDRGGTSQDGRAGGPRSSGAAGSRSSTYEPRWPGESHDDLQAPAKLGESKSSGAGELRPSKSSDYLRAPAVGDRVNAPTPSPLLAHPHPSPLSIPYASNKSMLATAAPAHASDPCHFPCRLPRQALLFYWEDGLGWNMNLTCRAI